jgi:membrane-associated phospholipid phosphatase
VPTLGVEDTVGLSGHDAGSFHGLDYNPYAAMPSMHVGWALLVGIALLHCSRRRGTRALAILYPVFMAVTVVVTGNHYVVDCIAGAVIATVSIPLAAATQVAWSRVAKRATGARRTPKAGPLVDKELRLPS